MASERPDEDGLIARFFRPLATDPGAAELKDDAAVYTPPEGFELVMTADAVAAGVHFFPNDPPEAIAQRALRVNLSDLAAKGARPVGYLMTLSLPEDWKPAWLQGFSRGLQADQSTYRVSLFGGDTIKTTGPCQISITAFGLVKQGRTVRRSGASVGDHVMLSGTLGDAALGLMLRHKPNYYTAWDLNIEQRDHLLERYLKPRPRVKLASAVAGYASASMDVSDGLLGDLERLCLASDVSAAIEVDDLPLSLGAEKALRADFKAQSAVLGGGDDYEILCTVPAQALAAFREAAQRAHVPVKRIGEVVGGPAGRLRVTSGGRVLNITRTKYQHF